MKTLALTIPYPTPSLNDLVGRGSRWTFGNAVIRWERFVTDAYVVARVAAGRTGLDWPMPPKARVRLDLVRVTRGPLLDRDNFVGGLKPVLDAVKHCQLIDDDTPAVLDLHPEQRLNRTVAACTMITLTIEAARC